MNNRKYVLIKKIELIVDYFTNNLINKYLRVDIEFLFEVNEKLYFSINL